MIFCYPAREKRHPYYNSIIFHEKRYSKLILNEYLIMTKSQSMSIEVDIIVHSDITVISGKYFTKLLRLLAQ